MLFVKANNLSGAFLWTIDLDDFEGKNCEEGRFPLLNAIKSELNQPNDYYDLYDLSKASFKKSSQNPILLFIIFILLNFLILNF